MKKSVLIAILLTFVLIFPIVSAQTYSGSDRFFDNIKMFFSTGDNKVMLALEIREKEVNSAMVNAKNGNAEEAEINLERARKRLQFVQNKVSKDIAEDVKTNVDEIINEINVEENLPASFDTYVLEEEKTQLTAELVIEVEGKEGQTLTREIVKDGKTGQNKVEIIVMGDDGQTRVMEIEGKIGQIDNQIAEHIVKNDMGTGNGGLSPVFETDLADGDDGLEPEVKTHVAGDGTENNIDEGNNVEGSLDNVIDVGTVDEESPEDTVDDTSSGDTGSNDVGGVDDGPGDPGVVDDDSGSGDSGESEGSEGGGDSVTGEVIKTPYSDSLFKKILDWLFKK